MLAYKMFNKDLTCRGYQFPVGEWVTEEVAGGANTARNGFHCADNPLDCLSYYSSFKNSVCYIVEAAGDINEDGFDSKIACTKMRLIKQLDLTSFVAHAMKYVAEHPQLKSNSIIEEESYNGYGSNNFVIVRGKNPRCKAPKGTVVGLIKEKADSVEVEAMDLFIIGDGVHNSNRYYSIGS